ncbi:hypothetical protein HPB48_005264 [Haemaphysalis longicornis]|uniref:Uncharacterized protein n=1 Tax=Haemaphysalis longicornis TaxID=44386 RepID=A0A9J6FLS5_HAELO|nr:hypothetical protein HPB48_005264 [Haemaphysalis longicornis]
MGHDECAIRELSEGRDPCEEHTPPQEKKKTARQITSALIDYAGNCLRLGLSFKYEHQRTYTYMFIARTLARLNRKLREIKGRRGLILASVMLPAPKMLILICSLLPTLVYSAVPNDRVVKSYMEGSFVYPMIYYTVLLERRSSLHLFTVLLPTVAVVLLSLLVFWLPPESDRKWTLTAVALLTSLLLLYQAEDILAGSTEVPKIVKVLGSAVFMNALIAASTVLSANMAKSPPSWTLPAALVRFSESLVLRLPCPCPVGQPGNGGDAGVQNKSFSNAMAREWATAARALDRILGLVFTATFVVLLCI